MSLTWRYSDTTRQRQAEDNRTRVETWARPNPFDDSHASLITYHIRGMVARQEWALTVAIMNQPTPFWPLFVGSKLREARQAGRLL